MAKEKKKCKQCKEYENQLGELKDLMKRVQADFENHQKRTEKETKKVIVYANQKMAVDLLPVIDSFEAAMGNSNEGLKILYTQLMKTLQAYGLQKIKAEGEFNPEMHEAMMTEEGEEDDIVLEELQSGYIMNDMVIRPAKVKISKKKQQDKNNSKNPKKYDNKKDSSKKDN